MSANARRIDVCSWQLADVVKMTVGFNLEDKIIMLMLCFWNAIISWRHSYLRQSDPEISGARIWMVSLNYGDLRGSSQTG